MIESQTALVFQKRLIAPLPLTGFSIKSPSASPLSITVDKKSAYISLPCRVYKLVFKNCGIEHSFLVKQVFSRKFLKVNIGSASHKGSDSGSVSSVYKLAVIRYRTLYHPGKCLYYAPGTKIPPSPGGNMKSLCVLI